MKYVPHATDVLDAHDPVRTDADQDRLSVRRLLQLVRSYRMLIAGIMAAAVLFGIGYIRTAEHRYTASMVIGPVSDTNQLVGGMDFSATTGSGLLSALSAPKVTPLATMKQLLHSELVARELMQDVSIRDRFFPGLWDEAGQRWRRPQGLMPSRKGSIKTMLGLPAWVQPSPGLLQQALVSAIQVTDERETGFTTLSYEDRDPAFAVHLLNVATNTADHIMRDRTRNEASRRIAFISTRLETDGKLSVDHRQVLIRFLASEEQKLIGVAAGTPMAADTIIPPTASPQITSPNWKAVLAASVIFGTFLSLAGMVLLPGRIVPGPNRWIVPPVFAALGLMLGIMLGYLAG